MTPRIGSTGAMDHHEKMRMRAAAFRVKRVYPGAAGEVLAAEILSWEEFGYRLGNNSKINRLVDQIMTAVIPTDPAAPPVPPARTFGGFITQSAT